MTPVNRRSWGLREKRLAGHFIVQPATLEGLAELAESFELPGTSDFPRWDQSSLGPSPPSTDQSVTIAQLREYLGEDRFQWLCTCAVYPELEWDLSLYLGSLPSMGNGLVNERNLLRLIQLPWFRAGSIPDELRLQLIGELDLAREREVRSAIIQVLERNPAPHGTYAADAQRLDIAAQKVWLDRDDRKKLREAVAKINGFPQADLTRDYTLMRFLESAQGSRLAVLLPLRLRKMFYENGIPSFGLKTGMRALTTCVSVIGAWMLAGTFLPVRDYDLNFQELATLSGHVNSVESVSFSPDGKTLASGSDNGTFKLWDVAGRREIATFYGHTGSVESVSFSPDSKTLASGSWDNTIKLWDVPTRFEIATFKGHEQSVYSVSFSPDGKTLASGSEDNTIKLWDMSTLREIATLKAHADSVYSVSFSPDGKTLVSGSDDNTIKLWDVPTRREIATLKGHEAGVPSITFSPDGKTLASGSDDKTIKLWNVAGRHEIATLSGHTAGVSSVTFSPDGKTLASGSGDDTIKLWDVGMRQNVMTLNGHKGYVRSVAFAPDGNILASASDDKTIKLWGDPRLDPLAQEGSPKPTSTSSPSIQPSPTQAPAAPQITITPRSLNFGDAEVTAIVQPIIPARNLRSVQIRNTGTAMLRISNAIINSSSSNRNNSFWVYNLGNNNGCYRPPTISPDKSCSIAISFIPMTTGRVSATLVITSNAPDSPHRVALSGNGVEPDVFDINPNSLNFGAQEINTRSNPRIVTLTNRGKVSLNVRRIDSPLSYFIRSGKEEPSSGFEIIDNNCRQTTLNPRSSCTVGIIFFPKNNGDYRGTLIINLGRSTARVELRGIGGTAYKQAQ
ncbi:MAG: choice-of-anchor D domain-containing protein [Acidobacteria bacterium]|nr:choice-of-anchor D domain-containing protein [Acidobacteriota bacterium]